MPKQKLDIMPKKFKLNEKISIVEAVHWSPEKIALEYIKTGLKREGDIISKEIIKGRLGISKDINDIVIEKCKTEVKMLVNRIIETLEKEFKLYRKDE